MNGVSLPQLGFGLGLRAKHYSYIFDHKPPVDWFEIISENYMDTQGRPIRNLSIVKELYPVVMHGVSLSIGTVDPLNSEYLRKLKKLMDWVKPAWISDHLCWTGVAHKNTHDLLPVPYTEDSLKHIIQRIREVQDYLETTIALENPSTYLEFQQSSMSEAEFIARMASESGCNLLLDVNNVYVSCFNHRWDVKEYLDTLPMDKVVQIHLSGHTNKGTHIVDTHDSHVIDEVWNLYKYVVNRAGRVPNTMIEWDDHIPDFPEFFAELEKAKKTAEQSQYVLPDLFQAPPINPSNNEENSLFDTQVKMQDAIIKAGKFDSIPQSWIKRKESFPPQEQLNVYINAYRYRLYDVVAEDYPVLKKYLDSKPFHDLIWSFVNSTVPDHFNIARYATSLPSFIERHMKENIFAHELCQLETAISQIADGDETSPLEKSYIEKLSADNFLKIALYPRAASELMSFSHEVNEYYSCVMQDKDPAEPRLNDTYLAVFRHEDTVWRMDLEKREYELLKSLFAGNNIEDAFDKFPDTPSEAVTNWFSRWMQNGLFASDTNNPTIGANYESAA